MKTCLWFFVLLLVLAPSLADESLAHRRPRRRLLCLVVGLILLVGLGVTGWLCSPRPQLETGSEGQLQIEIMPLPHQRAGDIRVAVEVRNVGSRGIGWDSEFSAFLRWTVTTSDGTPVRHYRPSKLEQTEDSLSAKRFAGIAPGKNRSRELDLSGSIRVWDYWDEVAPPMEEGSSGHRHMRKVAYEEVVRFDPPSGATRLRIQLHYSASVPEAAGFYQLFGFSCDDVNMWRGWTSSNEIMVEL